jgi:hypothetical protein
VAGPQWSSHFLRLYRSFSLVGPSARVSIRRCGSSVCVNSPNQAIACTVCSASSAHNVPTHVCHPLPPLSPRVSAFDPNNKCAAPSDDRFVLAVLRYPFVSHDLPVQVALAFLCLPDVHPLRSPVISPPNSTGVLIQTAWLGLTGTSSIKMGHQLVMVCFCSGQLHRLPMSRPASVVHSIPSSIPAGRLHIWWLL